MKEPTRQQIKEAFNKTIERWEKIVEDVEYFDQSNCALCQMHPQANCQPSICPIGLYTNSRGCIGTPYRDFNYDKTPANALTELNFLRKVYIWWMEKEANKILDKVAMHDKEEEEKICGNCEDFRSKENALYGHCADFTKSQEIKWQPTDSCSRWRMKKEEKKEEWVDVTEELKWGIEGVGLYYYLGGYYKGERIVNLDMEGAWIPNFPGNKNFKVESVLRDFRILKKS